ncbi:MAG: hypothetical protein CSB34_04010 [Desulfobulbus propionicus]|nr:MAG: hypothetical protein CSB34_04010 [Desulfobulbus propionicus]
MKACSLILLLLFLYLPGCKDESRQQTEPSPTLQLHKTAQIMGCKGCHPEVVLDTNHALSCVSCHQGNNETTDMTVAHEGLVAHPAHPEHMEHTCGSCHPQQIQSITDSIHFTLQHKINQTRAHFGINPRLISLADIPIQSEITTKTQLVEDMLRRRCLRCHLFSPGDDYPYVSHGTGCAACHLSFTQSKLDSHRFIKPTLKQCQSCHYGNYVGNDYSGGFENDYNWEYRTPYAVRKPYLRPFGVEQQNLAADIHFQRGLDCIDCHTTHETLGEPTCLTCHNAPQESAHIHKKKTQYILTAHSGKQHIIPQMTHPAHKQYGDQVACQVCHAQWSFNDSTTHLLLSMSDEYDQWERLTVQSSSELENLLEHNLYSEEDELPPAMRDGVTGTLREGFWLKGYTQRRWEDIRIQKDKDNIIKIFRPILDLSLSMIDADGEVLFDNLKGKNSGLLPYTPHTTGHAGVYYKDRFQHLLPATHPQ